MESQKSCKVFVRVIILATCVAPVAAARGGDELETLLQKMPADVPVAFVVPNFEKLDKSVLSFVKAVDPGGGYEGMLADMKKGLPIGEWVKFDKPVGLAILIAE